RPEAIDLGELRAAKTSDCPWRMIKSDTQKTKASVAVVGAGRLGQAFAIALQSSGYSVVALAARRRPNAEKAAALLHKVSAHSGGKPRPKSVVFGANQLGELPETELVLIATPDDAILETAQRLSSLW